MIRFRRYDPSDGVAVAALAEWAMRDAGTDPTDIPGHADVNRVETAYLDAGGEFVVGLRDPEDEAADDWNPRDQESFETGDGLVVATGGYLPDDGREAEAESAHGSGREAAAESAHGSGREAAAEAAAGDGREAAAETAASDGRETEAETAASDGREAEAETAGESPREAVELHRMRVAPPCQGRGYGRQLLAELERRARAEGYARVLVTTARRQERALALYAGAGYRQVGTSRNGSYELVHFERSLDP